MDYRAPMHIQLVELIKTKIEDGEYKSGEKIPSERKLSKKYGLTRMTVRNAISKLVNEGTLKRVHGKGTFVTDPKVDRDLTTLMGFTKTMIEKGIKPKTKLIDKEKRQAGYIYSKIFDIDPKDMIYKIVRLRLGDNKPIAIEYTYLPYNLITDIEKIDFEVFSFYDVLKLNGIDLDYGSQTLTTGKINRNDGKLLDIYEDTVVFLFECTSYDDNDRVIEFTKSYTRGDMCNFYTELK